MTTIIGIDPGSRRTGYGVIRVDKQKHFYITSGHIDVISYPATERLRQIYLALQQIINEYTPDEAAIEQIFMHENANSALKLGQARGAAIVALGIPIAEYTARQVKQSIVGHGAAQKNQVQFMVSRLLNIRGELQADAADALAVAICHAYTRNSSLIL